MVKKEFFSSVRVRKFPDKNYHAIWNHLQTIRLGKGVAAELDPDRSEFYDVGINTKCNAECPFCYVSATGNGINFPDICETWTKWMSTFPEDEKVGQFNIFKTSKPFQIAIGSTGEPTIHPQFCEFLETVYNTGVVPNYTTNGIVLAEGGELSDKILEYTDKYCGGVAVSFSNPALTTYARMAVEKLMEVDVKINLHHIISDIASVDRFLELQKEYDSNVYYHVLLPLMPSGRSAEGLSEDAWDYLEEKLHTDKLWNVAFGAHFIKNLEKSKKIQAWLYPAESLSKNIILTKDCVKITPSSFDLKPIKEIKL